MSGLSATELLQKFRTVTDERRATLTAMSDEEWNTPTMTPAGQDSVGRFMRIRTFDCWMHEQDIREVVARPASDAALQSPAARLSLDEIETSMAFVVGKRGGAPDGSRVAIELTGPLARTIAVAVDGRAAVGADFGGAEPTTTTVWTAGSSPGCAVGGHWAWCVRSASNTTVTSRSAHGSSSTWVTSSEQVSASAPILAWSLSES
jgi:uncharacterized protein (TIGR03083 family)